jgi:lysozyme
MKISDTGITLIKNFEGFKGKAYLCPAGKITIGYGHTGPELTLKDEITRERAEQILKKDLQWAEGVVSRHVKVPLGQHQFDVLVSLVFNIGEGNFASSSLLKMLNKGKYDEVPAQLARWNKITQGKKKVVSAGLVRRRQAEADLWIRTSDAPFPMPQEVATPVMDKPLAKSRTMANASAAGVVGTAVATAGVVAPVIEPAGRVMELAQDNTEGFFIVIGLAIVVFAVVAAYLRWDDKRKMA